jgi:hypothetical protein
MATPDDKT